MKRKEIQELKAKTMGELEALLRDSRRKLRDMQFDLSAGKVKNVSAIRALRKDIARISTFLNAQNA